MEGITNIVRAFEIRALQSKL
jgi:hypothetical protein